VRKEERKVEHGVGVEQLTAQKLDIQKRVLFQTSREKKTFHATKW
jgi:hypothetical protein